MKKQSESQWFLMVPNYWKVLKTITFLDFRTFTKTMKRRCWRGSQKSCFLIQNGDFGLPGSSYPLICDVLVRCPKIIILGRLPDRPTNRAAERQRVEKVPSIIRRRQVSRRQGSPGSIESMTIWPLDHPERIPTRRWAEGPTIFVNFEKLKMPKLIFWKFDLWIFLFWKFDLYIFEII